MAPRTTNLAKCRIRQSDIARVKKQIVAAAIDKDKLSGYRKTILQHHQKATTSALEAMEHRVLCGRALADARDYLGHGHFLRWVDEEFTGATGFGRRTAQRYLALHKEFEAYIAENADGDSGRELIRSFCNAKLESVRISKEADAGTDDNPNDWLTPEPILAAVKRVLGDIECDPCATSSPFAATIASIEYSVVQNGLSPSNSWPGRAWIAPGHAGDFSAWAEKTLDEFREGNLDEAIVCLPVDTPSIPSTFFSFPIAISREPLTVGYPDEKGIVRPHKLRSRSLFFYISATPDLRRFAEQFCDIAVAFAPLGAARSRPTDQLPASDGHPTFDDAFASIRSVMAAP